MALRLAGIGSPEVKTGQLSQENVSSSANSASFRTNVTDHSGIVTDDSGGSRESVNFNQNWRSRSVGTTGHVQTESAVKMVRNTQLSDFVQQFGTYDRYGAKPFGGVGLSSTVVDYWRFVQMLLNEGELGGARILGRKTVELMTTDNLPSNIDGLSSEGFPAGQGYCLGVGVLNSPVANGNIGSVSQYGWAGAALTWVIIDPKEDMVSVIFLQYPIDFGLLERFQTLVYLAITGR